MFFTSIYYYIFLLIGSSCLLFIRKQRWVCVNFLLCILFVLLCLPALRETGIDRGLYESFYYTSAQAIDYMHSKICDFTKLHFDNIIYLYGIYALIGIGLKLFAIRLFSPYIWLSVLMYISYYFVLHDMIQIRASVVSGILLLLTKYYYEKGKYLLYALPLIGVAVLFHSSGIFLLMPLFLNAQKLQKKTYLFMILFSITVALLKIDFFVIFQKIPVAIIQFQIEKYLNAMDHGREIGYNIFGIAHFVEVLVCIYMIYIADEISPQFKYYIILLKTYIIGVSIQYLFFSIPAIAARTFEMLSIVQILLIPSLLYAFRKSIACGIFSGYTLMRLFLFTRPLLLGVFSE